MRSKTTSHALLRGICVALAGMALLAGPAVAEDQTTGWQPPPPMPDDFDWIQLNSGEWLKGEIIVMYEDSLQFDSDELDELTLDFSDIKQIRSAQTIQVAFEDDTVAVGKLFLDGEELRVLGDGEVASTRSQVLSLIAGQPKERNYWSGKIGAGLNLRTGNTEQTEFNANATVQRRTPKDRIQLDYLGNFSQSQGETLADNQRADANWKRFLSKRFYVSPVFAEYYRDPFQNIAARYSIGAGAGYNIVDSSKIEWDVSAGLAYQRTDFDQVLEGDDTSADTPALAIGTRYDNELTGWMDYFFDYSFFVVNEESGTYNHNIYTGFEFEFLGDFDFDVGLVWDRIQDPRQSSDGSFPQQDDFRTIFGLSYSF
jgi:hypothetical protein